MTDKLESFILDIFKKQLIRKILIKVRETLDREREKLEKIEYSFIDVEFIRKKIEKIDKTEEAMKLYIDKDTPIEWEYQKIIVPIIEENIKNIVRDRIK